MSELQRVVARLQGRIPTGGSRCAERCSRLPLGNWCLASPRVLFRNFFSLALATLLARSCPKRIFCTCAAKSASCFFSGETRETWQQHFSIWSALLSAFAAQLQAMKLPKEPLGNKDGTAPPTMQRITADTSLSFSDRSSLVTTKPRRKSKRPLKNLSLSPKMRPSRRSKKQPAPSP